MGKNELDDSAKQKLCDFATKDAQLVWNRYGCMVVANSIFLGFIGQLATKKCNVNSLGIWACGIGLLIALLWLFLTSYGWSLSSYVFYKSKTPQQKAYREWKAKMWKELPKDPMWFFAHLVIILFCLAYILLTSYFSKSCFWPVVFFIVLIIALLFWWYKVASFDEAKDEQKQ